eukprot:scaffold413385_cov33-Prasinocladus_malaysianus.AAC.1
MPVSFVEARGGAEDKPQVTLGATSWVKCPQSKLKGITAAPQMIDCLNGWHATRRVIGWQIITFSEAKNYTQDAQAAKGGTFHNLCLAEFHWKVKLISPTRKCDSAANVTPFVCCVAK